ncbi:hypothetical protein [Deinococcus sp. QL22]|uniref:hypothetical protein n=1 Tax=Deinococcus sp. QL22 TaxID=2939437 RepID=UPI00201817CC|nr:hypothetical protein [Deinococcus sp. QL22]UQN06294.1 hypothetical protein M1R55_15765 [Deinococcus sp. QL22]
MKNLLTPTGLFANGRWLRPGSSVPGDLKGFDYEKHARKGMLEDTEGAEIVNPAPEVLEFQPAQEAAQLKAQPDPELQQTKAALTGAQTEVERLKTEQTRLQTELATAQAAAAKPEDVALLADYREAVGKLLPKGFPARKILFNNGYYTLDVVQAAPDQDLLDLDGIAETLLGEIRKLAPYIAPSE